MTIREYTDFLFAIIMTIWAIASAGFLAVGAYSLIKGDKEEIKEDK